jgi:hypothetical protein
MLVDKYGTSIEVCCCEVGVELGRHFQKFLLGKEDWNLTDIVKGSSFQSKDGILPPTVVFSGCCTFQKMVKTQRVAL